MLSIVGIMIIGSALPSIDCKVNAGLLFSVRRIKCVGLIPLSLWWARPIKIIAVVAAWQESEPIEKSNAFHLNQN